MWHTYTHAGKTLTYIKQTRRKRRKNEKEEKKSNTSCKLQLYSKNTVAHPFPVLSGLLETDPDLPDTAGALMPTVLPATGKGRCKLKMCTTQSTTRTNQKGEMPGFPLNKQGCCGKSSLYKQESNSRSYST